MQELSWMLVLGDGWKEGRAAVYVCELGPSASECDLSWDTARALRIQCHQESGHWWSWGRDTSNSRCAGPDPAGPK